MKQFLRSIFAGALLLLSGITANASDPQIFVYRNDGGFNGTHLRNGACITHSFSTRGPLMRMLDERGVTTDIPLSAIDSCVVRLTDIPTLRISLPAYPDSTDLWDKETYLDAVLDIEGNGYCEDSSGLELAIRGRGNTTWTMAKKPMRLKFPKKISLFGMAKQKNYVLLANYIDPSLVRNAAAFWIARRLGVPFANHTVPVNVEINGCPRGSYLVTEKVGINSGSVNIDETKGILFELSTEYDEPYKFRSDRWDLPVMVKDPDLAEIAEANPGGPDADGLLEMWRKDFNDAVSVAMTGKSSKAFDIESFVRGLLLYNICLNQELGYPKSMYLHKEAAGTDSLYKFGPAWDFDVAFDFSSPAEDGSYSENAPDTKLWINPLLRVISGSSGFMTRYRAALEKFASEDMPELLAFIRTYAAQIEPSAKTDAQIWPEKYDADWYRREPASNVRVEAEKLCQWLTKRIAALLERAKKSQL